MDAKILIIDDDAVLSENMKAYFENEGYEVKVVGDGVEGISFWVNSPLS